MLCIVQLMTSIERHAPQPTRRQLNRAIKNKMGHVTGSDSDWEEDLHHGKRSKRRHSKKRRPKQQRFGIGSENKRPKNALPRAESRNCLSNERKLFFLAKFDTLRIMHATKEATISDFVSRHKSLPKASLRHILRKRKSIEAAGAKSTAMKKACYSKEWLEQNRSGLYPKEEHLVFAAFLQARMEGKQVVPMWFSAEMINQLKKSQPIGWQDFKASQGWQQRVFGRFNLVIRATTNTKAKTIEERLHLCIRFYSYFLKVCCEARNICGVYGYPLSQRVHIDEVPFELSGVLNTTVSVRGERRIQTKSAKVRVEARSASLMLSFFGDGRVGPPAICLPLTPKVINGVRDPTLPYTRKNRTEIEQLRSDFPDMGIFVQKNSYFDNVTCTAWLRDFCDQLPLEPHVVVMDNLDGHATQEFRAEMKAANCELVFTPPDCTDLCAVTDAGLGRSVKRLMKEMFRSHFRDNHDAWCNGTVTAAQRRRLAVMWFDAAVKAFALERRQQIVNAFRRCGMGGKCDGSENGFIKIEGYKGAIKLE